MTHSTPHFFVIMALFGGLLISDSATGRAHDAHSGGMKHSAYTSNRPVVLAQATAVDCRPGDSTVACCIKKHPGDPAGACGATQSEVDQVLRAVRAGSDADDDDYSNNSSLPEWKQDCIRNYNRCLDRGWIGKCDDCLRRCEGQHEWPRDMCRARR